MPQNSPLLGETVSTDLASCVGSLSRVRVKFLTNLHLLELLIQAGVS